MSTTLLLSLIAPVFGLGLRFLGKWLWARVTGRGQLDRDLDENEEVVNNGSDADINTVLDDRLH